MAMQTFALVEWIGDDKPECWQVIKSADAFPQVKEISQGAVLDGIWKEGEETSPAKILKVHDSKQYLQTVKENEYCKPWRNKVPVKRSKSAPKTLQEYVTDNDEPETSKKQGVTIASVVENQSKKQQTKETKSNKMKKIKKKAPTSEKKNTGVTHLAPSESEDEETEPSFSKKTMKSSKDEAEKVLAAAILQKRRASSPIIPCGDVHKHKQVSPIKANYRELSEINNQVEAFGLPKIRDNTDQECCRCCKKHNDELKDLRQEVTDLKKSVKRLKKHFSEVRESQEERSGESNSTTALERSYREAVKNSTSLFGTIYYLIRKIYSKEEILVRQLTLN